MPIFEYRCNACNEVSEFLVLGKDEVLSCAECGSPWSCGTSLRRVLRFTRFLRKPGQLLFRVAAHTE